MDDDLSALHRDPDVSEKQIRSNGRERAERSADREVDERDEPARDAEPSDRAVAIYTVGNKPVVFPDDERKRHIGVFGKTGMGKSTLLRNLALSDIERGHSVVYIDPHGQDAPSFLDSAPPELTEKFIYFDLSDTEYAPCWNPLAHIPLYRAASAAANITEGWRDIFKDAWSERMSWFLYNALVLLIEAGNADMSALPPLFYDERHQAKWVARSKSASTRDFWEREYWSYPASYRREAPGAILNRIGQLLASDTARNILCPPRSKIDIATALDKNYVIIVNLAKGSVGNNAANIFGSLLVSSIRDAIMSRSERDPSTYPETRLHIDESQSVATMSLKQILSESRKFKLGATLANQYLSQLDKEVLAATLGNIGTIISFRVSAADSDILIGDFDPYSPVMLTDQAPYYARMKRDIQTAQIMTVPFAPKHSGRLEIVRTASRRRFSRRV